MSYDVFGSDLLQFIEAWKELVGRCCRALLTARSSRSKAVKKRCWQQRLTL